MAVKCPEPWRTDSFINACVSRYVYYVSRYVGCGAHCFTICFTICLCISPDLDGKRLGRRVWAFMGLARDACRLTVHVAFFLGALPPSKPRRLPYTKQSVKQSCILSNDTGTGPKFFPNPKRLGMRYRYRTVGVEQACTNPKRLGMR